MFANAKDKFSLAEAQIKLDTSCELSAGKQTIHMKYQALFAKKYQIIWNSGLLQLWKG